MSGYDVRRAAARRDEGVRTVSKWTWRAGIAGAACSAVLALAFGHHANAQTAQHHQQGILVPSQPPAPGHGAGQVTSGAT